MNARRGTRGNHVQQENDATVVSRLANQDNIPWYRKPNLRLLYLLMIPTCLAVEITSGYDASMVNGLQAVPSWLEYYNYPRSASLGLMASMYSLGSVAAVPFTPFVVDKFGRRFPILLGAMGSIVGGLLQGSALDFLTFIIARFILGSAGIFCTVAASSLIGELSYPKERAILGGLFGTSFYLGSIIAAAVTFGTFAMSSDWGWRIPSFLQILPSLFQVSFICFIPESPRWLISRGRRSEARAILVKYHAEGDENSEFAEAEYTQIEKTFQESLSITGMTQKAVFSTPGMQKRVTIAAFLGLCAYWGGAGLFSHFLAPILDNVGIHDNRSKNLVNLGLVSWKFVTGSILGLVAPRYPRRRMYLASSISLVSVLTAFTIASAVYSVNHSKISAEVVVALIFLFTLASNLGFGCLDFTFLPELFPFHARASGVAIHQWFSRGGGFIAQFMNPIGIDALGWRWYIAYCVWNAIGVVFVYLMFPETSGRTLEELVFLFEEDRVVLEHGRGASELLCEHEASGAYGTMENHPGRSIIPSRDGSRY